MPRSKWGGRGTFPQLATFSICVLVTTASNQLHPLDLLDESQRYSQLTALVKINYRTSPNRVSSDATLGGVPLLE